MSVCKSVLNVLSYIPVAATFSLVARSWVAYTWFMNMAQVWIKLRNNHDNGVNDFKTSV